MSKSQVPNRSKANLSSGFRRTEMTSRQTKSCMSSAKVLSKQVGPGYGQHSAGGKRIGEGTRTFKSGLKSPGGPRKLG
jgi:hypothetical protein